MDQKDDSDAKKQVSVKGFTSILDALLTKGLISNDSYNQVKFDLLNESKSAEQILVEKKITDAKTITRTKAEMSGVAFVDLGNIFIPKETISLIPQDFAKQSQVVVFDATKSSIKVAAQDPNNVDAKNYIEKLTGKTVEMFYAAAEDINKSLTDGYKADLVEASSKDENGQNESALSDLSQMANVGTAESSDKSDTEDTAPVIKILNMILDYGVKNKASDIHIEPRESNIVVRLRVRGILSEKLTLPKKLLLQIISRIKILANLKIDEHRIPQDGRFQVNTDNGGVDVRVSIMPSLYGEKVVMRLLEKGQSVMKLEQLGVTGVAYSRIKESLQKTQGIILVTGPTNSGKSHTIASSLQLLNTPEINIITLEDPVEIRINGVNQVQVNSEVGLTFASGLRSILRQDPDVILVGEIRDAETAALAVQAALVGRLVLSTIHTNSAAAAFVRLMDMGIEPFLLSSTVNLIVAQRLVRVLCNECKQEYKADENVMTKYHEVLDPLNGINIYSQDGHLTTHFDRNVDSVTLYKAVGCEKCNKTGYTGRTGIFEALKMSENISSMVVREASLKEISDAAVAEGMITMLQDGFIKALEGITSIEEVLRVRSE